jgi:hypothetical protein
LFLFFWLPHNIDPHLSDLLLLDFVSAILTFLFLSIWLNFSLLSFNHFVQQLSVLCSLIAAITRITVLVDY